MASGAFDQWTVERLTEPSEVAIIDAWVARVQELCDERGIGIDAGALYHWSPAETSTLTTRLQRGAQAAPGERVAAAAVVRPAATGW